MNKNILNILFLPQKPTGTGVGAGETSKGNKNKNVGSGHGGSSGFVWGAVVIGIVIIAAIGASLFMGHSSTGTQPISQPVGEGKDPLPETTDAPVSTEKKTTIYTPKYNPDGADRQEISFENIPETIPLGNNFVIRDLKIENDYFYGYIKNIAKIEIPLNTITFNYLDKDGIKTRYASSIEIRAYNDATKKYMWTNADTIPTTQEYYFRANTMKKYDTENEIKFLQIYK